MLEQLSKKLSKLFKFGSKNFNSDFDPDEIFLDSTNLPQFDNDQFEGRFERPIRRKPLIFLGVFFILLAISYGMRLWLLQVNEGKVFAAQSENNHTKNSTIFASRGVIYDRTGTMLAWNDLNNNDIFPLRKYIPQPGFAHVLGYVMYPKKDNQGNFYNESYQAVGGIEESHDATLSGVNGNAIEETNALGKLLGSSVTEPPKDGNNVKLSIDSRVEEQLYKTIEQSAHDHGFLGGGGVIMDIQTGEILAMTSFPEFSPDMMTNGDSATRTEQINVPNAPFLNRVVSGLYTPGSIVKPYMAMAALGENSIDPNKIIYTTGSLRIPNPYNPGQFSIFNDWKNLGPMDMRHALAMSSDVYFYEVGGGFQDQKGLGINVIDKYMAKFGFGTTTGIDLSGEKSGLVPSMDWKQKTFGENWLLGDTYHSSIGQYGWQVTPLQAARAVATIANNGVLRVPTLILGDKVNETKSTHVPVNVADFQIVREGMRLGVTQGVATALNTPAVAVAAKTGTAELGITKDYVNSWVTGFFPYDHPRYAFAVVMEHGSRYNLVGASFVMRSMFDWMALNTPEYFK